MSGQGSPSRSLTSSRGRLSWGNMTNPDTPGALVGGTEVPIPAPAPLLAGSFQCGDTITLRATGSADNLESIKLAIEADGSGADIGRGEIDLFGNIRQLLDDEGFAGKLSNANALIQHFGV